MHLLLETESANHPPRGWGKLPIDQVADYAEQRAALRALANHEETKMNNAAVRKKIDLFSRFKYISGPIQNLQFHAEAKEYAEANGLPQLFEFSYANDCRAPFIHNSLVFVRKQLERLQECAKSRAEVPCELMGCPSCSPPRRAEAIAEAAEFLRRIAAEKGYKKFFSFTLRLADWQVKLKDSDWFMHQNMAKALRMLTQVLRHYCPDILLSIEGSLYSLEGHVEPKDATFEQLLDSVVSWHLHGVLVSRDSSKAKADLITDAVAYTMRNHARKWGDSELLIKPLEVRGDPTKFTGEEGYQRWLMYMTKQLTADGMTANVRRAFRYCLLNAYTTGLLSTGPILYSSNTLQEICDNEEYTKWRREQREEIVFSDDPRAVGLFLMEAIELYLKKGWEMCEEIRVLAERLAAEGHWPAGHRPLAAC